VAAAGLKALSSRATHFLEEKSKIFTPLPWRKPMIQIEVFIELGHTIFEGRCRHVRL
jgi:hypothetical protein